MLEGNKINKTLPSHVAATKNLKIFHAISIACFVIAGMIALATIWFVYNYTFNTLNNMQTIGIIKSDLQIKPINFNMYDEVLSKKNTKASTSTLGITPDPFMEITSSTSKL